MTNEELLKIVLNKNPKTFNIIAYALDGLTTEVNVTRVSITNIATKAGDEERSNDARKIYFGWYEIMKKIFASLLSIIICVGIVSVGAVPAYAKDAKEQLSGQSYDLGEKDAYEISKGVEVSDAATRFSVQGDISAVSTKDGFTSYAVDSGNLKISVDTAFGSKLFTPDKSQDWHIITDKTKVVDATKLSQNIGSGAIVVQTSKDGKAWITADTETDIYNKTDTINNRTINGDNIGAFYETTNVQMANGCFYRIIVAYKLQREVDPSKILFVPKKNTEEKERVEIYEFYAYDPAVNHSEVLNPKKAYEFGDVYRVDSQDGFKNPELIKSDDPHIDWNVGKFYVSGYTDVRMDGDTPVFLKVPGDKAALWFNLEQELDKCNGRTDVKINYIDSGSDIGFGTPTIKDFGRGALIIRRTDKQNQKVREIYTNYLEASATTGANTRVDLFEEGDYEVALDYQLHYDKPFVFGTTTTKTLTYRIYFKFKVRNGDISVFLRDKDTNQFITNGNVAEHGFYIDVANSQYLNMSIKREVLTDSLDGLIEDTKFTAVATENRNYTDEGVYTVTIKNLATGDEVQKKVYVGNRDIMLVHMKQGISLSEIKERMEAGAYIDENGQLVDPEPEVIEEEVVEEIVEAELVAEASEETEVISEDNSKDVVIEEQKEETKGETEDTVSKEDNIEVEETEEKKGNFNMFVVLAVVIVVLLFVFTQKDKIKALVENSKKGGKD